MKAYKQKQWQHIITGTEGNAILFGVNIFDYEWKDTGKRASVKDPLYGQEFMFPIYRVKINNVEYEFACGEFSNAVYGFFENRY